MFSSQTDTVIRAEHFTNASRGDAQIARVVLHTTQGGPERPDFAEDVANFFKNIPADAPSDRRVSAHYVVDNNSVVGCVEEEDIANHAFGDNTQSVGIELAGKAEQTDRQWDDAYSKAQLTLAARLVADICKRRGIPARRLSNEELRERRRGIVSHKQVSDVFGAGIRSDPGPNFPWAAFLAEVRRILRPKQVRFVLVDGAGQELAKSEPVEEGFAAELELLARFEAATRRKKLLDLRDDRNSQTRRVNV
jgi:N-acetyl-anhydromuramyl-L-alanine amidase AmpD